MNDDTMRQKTGRSVQEWVEQLRRDRVHDLTHKEIAEHLHRKYEVSFWWAQEITVEIERALGRRVEGQTQDGMFQVGVRRTIGCAAPTLWLFLTSPDGTAIILGEGSDIDHFAPGITGNLSGGGSFKVTTFRESSHMRMRYQVPGWERHSILQVRVTAKGDDATTLTFHHERLPDARQREDMRTRWRNAADACARAVEKGLRK